MVFSIPVNHSSTVKDRKTFSAVKISDFFHKPDLLNAAGKVRSRWVALCSSILVSGFSVAAATAADVDLCEGMIDHTGSMAVPYVAKPPHGKYYREPAFRTRVMRMTDAGKGNVIKPMYSTVQAWNADETLMVLFHREGKRQGHYLYNGHTYEAIRKLDILPSDVEDVFWSHSEPHSLFYSSKASGEYGRLYKFNVASGQRQLLKDFSAVCKAQVALPGGDVQMQSLDDDLFGFRCLDSSNKNKKHIAFTYRVSTGETSVMELGEGTQWSNWTAPMPTARGRSVYFQAHTLSGNLRSAPEKLDMAKSGEHGNLGLSYSGQDALFQVNFNASPGGCNGDPNKGVGHLVEYNLETGGCRNIISEAKGYPYTTSGTHLSAQAYRRPGWVAVSSIGYKEQMDAFRNGKRAKPLFSEIYLANTDPRDTKVCRLAHHRSTGKYSKTEDYPPYYAEPHVTISPSGTRLLFGSDWYDSGSVDTYVIELNGYQRPLNTATTSDF